MAICVSETTEQRLLELVEAGRFASVEELLNASLQLLEYEDETLSPEEMTQLRRELEQAGKEADAGASKEFTLSELKQFLREP